MYYFDHLLPIGNVQSAYFMKTFEWSFVAWCTSTVDHQQFFNKVFMQTSMQNIFKLHKKKKSYENFFSYDSMKYSVNLILTQEQLPLLRHLYEDRF